MPYLNTRLHALVATGLLLLAAPALQAQDETSVVSGEIRGDVDGDGRVTAADAAAVRAYLVRGTVPEGRSILPAGDANADGRVTAADAALISRFAAGVDVSRFPVGRAVGDERVEETDISRMQLTLFDCSTSAATGATNCRTVTDGDAALLNIIVGAEGVQLDTSGTSVDNDQPANPDTVTFTWTLTNKMAQPIGTTDGQNDAPEGSRLFFVKKPYATSAVPTNTRPLKNLGVTPVGTLISSFVSAQGTSWNTREYYQFNGMLEQNETATKEVKFVYDPRVLTWSYEMLLATPVQFDTGRVAISPATSPVLSPGQTTQLTAEVFDYLGKPQGGVWWSTSNAAVASVDSLTGLVTGVGGGTATITATTDSLPRRVATRVIQVIQANPDILVATTGNVRINSDSTSLRLRVAANDTLHGATIVFAGYGSTPNKTLKGGDIVMNVDSGTFTYNPPAGFDGVDSLEYIIRTSVASGAAVDTGRVALPVSNMIWFVKPGPDPCTTRANGCGRLTHPYSSLAAFQAENNNSSENNPEAGDAIFLYEGAHTGSVALLANQMLVGQDATGESFETITGIDPAPGSDALPPMSPTVTPVTLSGGPAGGVVLGANNLLRGFDLVTSAGSALSGSDFGTPNISQVTISASAGPAISLQNGTLNSTFPNVTSTGSTGRGISLTNVNGTPTFTAGSISGSAQAAFFVSGGNVAFTWPGSISQANVAALVDVQGSHSGALVFSGTLGATNGAGLQFNAAQGTYTFSGTTTLGGTDAGIDITNGSGGTFTFGTGTAITNSAGTGVNVYGSAATVTYSGNITKDGTSTGRLVEVGEQTGGTVTFNTGTLSANSTSNLSTGISLSNADGTVMFAGPVTLSGGDAGVDLLSGTGGTVTFGASTSITNPSGTAFNVNASTPNVTFNGNITRNGTSPGRLVDVTGQTGGASVAANNTITFQSGTLSSTSSAGTGILLSNADGTVNFNGTTTLNGGDAGVDVEGGSGGVIAFASGTAITNPTNELVRVVNSAPTLTYTGSLNRTSGSGTGILAQSNTGGTLLFNGATKTLNTGAGAAVSLLSNTGTTIQFTNGNLDIDVTSGAGFNATGGGTVEVSGTLNTVTSTGGGRTVNIQNTSIGSNNVTFRNVTGTGAASGVRVENTGTAGGIKITGDGATASSGGIITMNAVTAADSAAYTLTNTANVGLEFVRVEVTTGAGALGIAASNLQGTNLVRNSVFDYNQIAPAAVPTHNAYAMYFAQTNSNATISIDGSSVNGTRSGASAGVLSARGSSVVTFNVMDSNTGDGFQSLFTDLYGSGWVIASGDGGASTAVVNLTVRDSRFTNAPANGTNNLEMGVSSNATMNFKVKDNLFQNVANASCICGIVNVNTQDAGVFGGNTAMDSIVGNTITNTGTSSAVADLGYIPMRIAFDNSSPTTNRVVIANNNITDSWRQGMLLSTRSSSIGNFKLINNIIGTAALPVGQSNRRGVETDLQQNSVMNLEMTANSVTGAGTVDAAAAVGLRVGTDVSGSATLNATLVSNSIRSNHAGTNGRFRAESSATSPGTLCLDLRTNNLEDNSKLYTLTHSGGTYRVEGAGGGAVTNAAIQAANASGNGNVSGSVLFNNGANCTQPPI